MRTSTIIGMRFLQWQGPHPALAWAARLLDLDRGQVLEPALRGDEAAHPPAHGARVEVMDDPEPGRIIDQPLMRRAQQRLDAGRIGRGLQLREGRIEALIAPM